MRAPVLGVDAVRAYLARKQRLLPGAQGQDPARVTRDIAALHATDPTTPYLSLWARTRGFERAVLDDALYERRTLVRTICMRTTLHIVPSDEMPAYVQASAARHARRVHDAAAALLVQAGLCQAGEARARWAAIQKQVFAAVRARGACTVRALSQAIPELRTQVRHSVGMAYEGAFSLGSRLVPAMCVLGPLVRARPEGTWRSNQYAYAALSDWLPGVDLSDVPPQAARTWLVRRYLSAFGPATAADIRWWTGLTARQTEAALRALWGSLVEVGLAGLEGAHWMLTNDMEQLSACAPPATPYAFLLPALDPYVMGYADRTRFLDPAHARHVLDRAGNAVPTVWIDGRIAGAWVQRRDGAVVYSLFEETSPAVHAALEAQAARLEAFLGDERLRLRSQTPFTRSLAS
ncbi:MAG: AlkZ family DNA glycosylase [Anaerolineae bacterium]|nr:AlkZ family DNA glycosylase [Anaerolineae bacterium]